MLNTLANLLFSLSLSPVYADSLPFRYESFLRRTDIFELKSQPLKKLNLEWENFKQAQLAFLAELLVIYPTDVHFYFLARDTEYLYDMSKLILAGTRDEHRIHLINVSRANKDSKNLLPYLEENGISQGQLENGKRILLIDTGFVGSILFQIKSLFQEKLQGRIGGQLLNSPGRGYYPPSQVFLHFAGSKDSHPDSTIYGFEGLPKKTQASSEFIYLDGAYHPISKKRFFFFRWYDSLRSLNLRRDLVSFSRDNNTRERFNFLFSQFNEILVRLQSDPNLAPSQANESLDLSLANSFLNDAKTIFQRNAFFDWNTRGRSMRFAPGISLCVLIFRR